MQRRIAPFCPLCLSEFPIAVSSPPSQSRVRHMTSLSASCRPNLSSPAPTTPTAHRSRRLVSVMRRIPVASRVLTAHDIETLFAVAARGSGERLSSMWWRTSKRSSGMSPRLGRRQPVSTARSTRLGSISRGAASSGLAVGDGPGVAAHDRSHDSVWPAGLRDLFASPRPIWSARL
jgi:hypothetical protein